MCGIFGIVSGCAVERRDLDSLAKSAEQRGRDSSGLMYWTDESYKIQRADYRLPRLLKDVSPYYSPVVMGYSRLITNGLSDNQPVIYEDATSTQWDHREPRGCLGAYRQAQEVGDRLRGDRSHLREWSGGR